MRDDEGVRSCGLDEFDGTIDNFHPTGMAIGAVTSGPVSASTLPQRVSGYASHGVRPRASQRSTSTASGSENGLSPIAFSRWRAAAMEGSSGTGGCGNAVERGGSVGSSPLCPRTLNMASALAYQGSSSP